MTILGALVEPARALVWSDSEFYRGKAPAGYCPKLIINPLAPVVLLGTGSSALLRAADEPTLRGTSVDDIATAICAALRKRAGQVAHQLTRANHHWLVGQLAVLVGFSEACGRMLAYLFSGPSFFEPIVTARLVQPEPDGVFIEPSSVPELVACARRQLACVRDTYPEASGGTLQVCELQPDRLTCWTVPDFDVGAAQPTPAQLADTRAGPDNPL